MPAKVLTPALASELAELALNGKIQSLHIDKRSSGKHKGKFFAEYTEAKEEFMTPENRHDRTFVHGILETLADDLAENVKIDTLVIEKTSVNTPYTVQYVARKGGQE